MSAAAPLPASELIQIVSDVRTRTLDLVSDLSTDELLGPRLSIVNPPLWEIGHVGWFKKCGSFVTGANRSPFSGVATPSTTPPQSITTSAGIWRCRIGRPPSTTSSRFVSG